MARTMTAEREATCRKEWHGATDAANDQRVWDAFAELDAERAVSITLLEACRRLIVDSVGMRGEYGDMDKAVELAEAVIAKAEGAC